MVAALTYGERQAQRRAMETVGLAPDRFTRNQQQHVADREAENLRLLEARLEEIGSSGLEDRYKPFFDSFFQHTEPADWVEAQTFHYVGDALVSDFAQALMQAFDPVSAEVVRRALCDRDEQDAFALDQLTNAIEADPGIVERVAGYARRVAGEALTQASRALETSDALAGLLGGEEERKHILLDLLERHRRRLDRLGIEIVEPD